MGDKKVKHDYIKKEVGLLSGEANQKLFRQALCFTI